MFFVASRHLPTQMLSRELHYQQQPDIPTPLGVSRVDNKRNIPMVYAEVMANISEIHFVFYQSYCCSPTA